VHNSGIDLELFVVDGGSSDGTLEILSRLAKEIPALRTIQLGKNLGTALSRNIAIRESRGEYILILDSDTEVLPGALGVLCKALEAVPRAGIVAPRLLYPDGSVQPSCKRFPTAPLKVCKFAPISLLQRLGEKAELYPPEVYSKDFEEIVRVDHCISACWLVRRRAIDAVGLLDERIFMPLKTWITVYECGLLDGRSSTFLLRRSCITPRDDHIRACVWPGCTQRGSFTTSESTGIG